MNPKIWGHIMWSYLINLALRYPDKFSGQDARQWQLLLGQLGYVLPCQVCKQHYMENLRAFPPSVNSKLEVLTWLSALYNRISNKNLSLNDFVNIGKNYNRTYFWKMLNYIIMEYPPDNYLVSFDLQLQYKQFIAYLFDMIPMRHIILMPVDQYLTNSHTFSVWLHLMEENSHSH